MVKKIKHSSPANSNSVITSTQQTITQTSGPLPAASDLKEYDIVLPGLAERIVTIAEAEVKHRHGMDREHLRLNELLIIKEYSERRLGQWLGFSIGMASLAVSIVSLFMGHEIAASIIGGTTVVGLVAVFVTGRFKKDTSSDPQAPESQ